MTVKLDDLQEQVRVYSHAQKSDDFGGYVERWKELGFKWASIKFASSRDVQGRSVLDVLERRAPDRKSLYKVVFREDESLKGKMRFEWKDLVLETISRPVVEGGSVTFYTCEIC